MEKKNKGIAASFQIGNEESLERTNEVLSGFQGQDNIIIPADNGNISIDRGTFGNLNVKRT